MMISPRRHEDHEEGTKFSFDDVSRLVVDAAFKVHQIIGPGLLEGIYEECLAVELRKRGISFARQVEVPVFYEGKKISMNYRLDLVVENSLIVEVKSVEKTIPAHSAQVLTYLRTAGLKSALLINFGDAYFKTAVKRFVL